MLIVTGTRSFSRSVNDNFPSHTSWESRKMLKSKLLGKVFNPTTQLPSLLREKKSILILEKEKKKRKKISSHFSHRNMGVNWFRSCFYQIWMQSSFQKKTPYNNFLPLPTPSSWEHLPLSVIMPQFDVFPVSLQEFLFSILIFQCWSFSLPQYIFQLW